MELSVFQFIILGIIQGITEWLPISSSAMTTLVMSNFFGVADFSTLLHKALFLHLGTFFAALIYFRHEVTDLFVSLFKYKSSSTDTKKLLKFLIVSTIVTAIIGLLILNFLFSLNLELTGKIVTLVIAILLLITAALQLLTKKTGLKKISHVKNKDSIVVGLAQGLSVLPGISRSGITVSTLLLKKFDDTSALKMSFLMSLPVVLLGNIFFNMKDLISVGITSASFAGLFVAFFFGLLTIHGLMKISKKINFGWFVLIFAVLMLISLFI